MPAKVTILNIVPFDETDHYGIIEYIYDDPHEFLNNAEWTFEKAEESKNGGSNKWRGAYNWLHHINNSCGEIIIKF